MDSARFEDLLRTLASGLSRRATLAALASGFFATGSAALLGDEAEAKKKHKHKKKKKKCKGGTKKCGKKCIPATGCCSSSECGANGTCVGNTCNCNSGFKDCNGECIPQSDCCEGCQGDLICDGGECVCPEDAPYECPGGVCLLGPQCCDTSECAGGQICEQGFCLCTETTDITCGPECCDSASEICDFGAQSCQAGGCVANDWCNGTDFFVCADNGIEFCVCASTAGPMSETVCIDYASTFNPENCDPCTTSADCGAGMACIPGEIDGNEVCACSNNFCVPLCGEGVPRSAKRSAGGTSIDLTAVKSKGRKRHR